MLYDKRWDKTEAKPDVFSLEGLIAWLEMQRPDEKYDYGCNGHCLLAQYFDAAGYDVAGVGGYYFRTTQEPEHKILLPNHFNNVAISAPYSFGAALDRARKALGARA